MEARQATRGARTRKRDWSATALVALVLLFFFCLGVYLGGPGVPASSAYDNNDWFIYYMLLQN